MSRTVLRGVTVVDTRDGALAPNMDITLDGGKIAAIEPAVPNAPDTPPSDTAGKFVVPGYLDMHAHPFELKDPAGTFELMLAHGITGFRQMSGSPEMLRKRAAGTLPMPADSPAVVAIVHGPTRRGADPPDRRQPDQAVQVRRPRARSAHC